MNYSVELRFLSDILGTVPLNKAIYEDYIATKPGAPPHAAEESESIAFEDKGKTGFHRLPDGTPFLYSYVQKGYLKDACGMMARVSDSYSSKLRAYKKVIDGLVFVEPRMIPFVLSGPIGELQRPLRAQTAQGERVALAFSETIPAGSTLAFTLIVLDDKAVSAALLRELLDYGKYRGQGQWRNASWGTFSYSMEAVPA